MRSLLLSLLCLNLATSVALSEPAKPLRALLIAGGCCHDYAFQTRVLTEGLSSRLPVQWTVVHDVKMVDGKDVAAGRDHVTSAYAKANWAEGFDVVVHDECYGGVKDPELLGRIASAHRKGVPAVFLHCSMHSYRMSEAADQWREWIGVKSTFHEKADVLEVKTVDAKHPVMIGFPSRWTTPEKDELYRVEKLWDSATVLGSVFSTQAKAENPVIWVNQVGGVRTFSTSLGHGNGVVDTPQYLDLVGRGLLWVCGKLGPDGKAVEGYRPSSTAR
jgi:type 1 glutamine amidotransferase